MHAGKRHPELGQGVPLQLPHPLLAELEDVGDGPEGHLDIVHDAEPALEDVTLPGGEIPQGTLEHLERLLSDDRMLLLQGVRVGDQSL